ncbi:MAG: FkbM family methyltransferase [Burkholderiaceae bacterium]|nr:FkbM family methyltransferase [Burkholderiaceae bacterium]
MRFDRVQSHAAGRPVFQRMLMAGLGRWLTRQGQALLGEGYPPMAVYAFDLVGHQINLRGRYEREELDAVMQLLQALDTRPRGLCIDIGANIGNHALFFARHYPSVWAFEPHPRTYQLLALNAQLAPQIRALPLGLSDAPGQAWIDLPPGNAGMAAVSEAPAQGRLACTLSTLDDELPVDAGMVSLIKIDVEGHEARVLRGAARTLARDQPVVLLEQAAGEFHGGSTPALDVLRELGYAHFVTLDAYPDTCSRWLNLASRLLRGEGYRFAWRERLPAQFHSMIVAVPARLAPAGADLGA